MEVDFKVKDSVFERVSRIVNSALSQDEMLGQILGLTGQVSNCDACLVYLMEVATGEFVLRASQLPRSHDLGIMRMKFGEGITGSVAENQRPVALKSRAPDDPRFKSIPGLIEDTYEAILSVPLVHKGRSIGVINVHHRDAHEHTAEEIASVAFIGEQMGAAIANGLLEEENARLAERDRRLEQQRLHLEAEVARRTEELEASTLQLQAAKDRAEAAIRLEKAAAEAEAANRAKSMFLSTMSHEIRTPLNAILGYAQLMLRDPGLGTEARANLNIINRSGEHLLALINDILDMSKIEAGKLTVAPAAFDLFDLLKDLEWMFRQRAESRRLRFEVLVEPGCLSCIEADKGKIRQVLVNLLGNAVKFTEAGSMTLRVSMNRTEDDSLRLFFAVEDTGPGIAHDEQTKLFLPFAQAESGRENKGGTGLGLAISRQLVRLMGGEMMLSSEAGRGSTFYFEIPVRPGEAAPRGQTAKSRRVVGLQAGAEAPRVLVVDDEPNNRGWLTGLLKAVGFSVQEAENGEAGIRLWQDWNPQLILMDTRMPVMDGMETTRRIRALPRGRETVIFALTASAMEDNRRAAMDSGVDDFLSKPCMEDELFPKMRKYLGLDYLFEEEKTTGADSAAPALDADICRNLAPELILALQHAVGNGEKDRLNELIERVADLDKPAACSLRQLADNYEYDALTHLLEEARA